MKIAVALSGGVDSATVALRLKQAGHKVMGLTMQICPDLSQVVRTRRSQKLSQPGMLEYGCSYCVKPCACQDASQVAREIGIQHELLDLREAFESRVIEPFIDDFVKGKTPNPCALCNREMKFGLLKEIARNLDAEVLATGHYVRRVEQAGCPVLFRPNDLKRDQTYFLSLVRVQQLQNVSFPLAEDYKDIVQTEAAASGGRSVVTSNEICFLRDLDYADFIRARSPEALQPGEIVDLSGRVLGEHKGLFDYTVGQRRGLGVAAREPLYVLRLEAETNRVVAGPEQALWARSALLEEMNWMIEPSLQEFPVLAQIRYRQQAVAARIKPGRGGSARLTFEQPVRAITPGQIAAVYQANRLLGGGRIVREVSDEIA